MRFSSCLVLAAALAATSAIPLCACKGGDNGPALCGETEAAPALDPEIMAFLSAARALHHEANLQEDAADLPGAIATMQRLVMLPKPHGGALVPEVEEVLADAYARLAELRIRTQDLEGAARDVDSGLAHAKDPTYFRGHLLEVQGLVAEANVRALSDAGRNEEAAKAKARAIELLEEAVSVQSKVIQKTLGEDAGGKRGR